jgi:hypothetical protein
MRVIHLMSMLLMMLVILLVGFVVIGLKFDPVNRKVHQWLDRYFQGAAHHTMNIPSPQWLPPLGRSSPIIIRNDVYPPVYSY